MLPKVDLRGDDINTNIFNAAEYLIQALFFFPQSIESICQARSKPGAFNSYIIPLHSNADSE